MLHRICQRIRSEPRHRLQQPYVIVRVLLEVDGIDGQCAQQHVILEQRQGRHRAILNRCLGIYVCEIKTRMKLVNGTSIRECKPGNAFTQSDAPSGELLSILAGAVACGSVTALLVVKEDDTGVERNDVAHLVNENLECVLDV